MYGDFQVVGTVFGPVFIIGNAHSRDENENENGWKGKRLGCFFCFFNCVEMLLSCPSQAS